MQYRAHATLGGDSVSDVFLTAIVTNPTDADVTLPFRQCKVLRLRVYRPDGAALGRPAWDQNAWLPRQGLACTDIARGLHLTPRGGAGEVTATVPVSSVLGDTLSPGTYRLEVDVVLDNRTATVPAGTLTLAR